MIAGEKGCGWRWKRAYMLMGKRIINKEPEKKERKGNGSFQQKEKKHNIVGMKCKSDTKL